MYILGISCFYHDSSACLIKDGKVVAAALEERFSRKKHDFSFPQEAIKFCLEQAGVTIKDVGYIGFYEKPFLKFERVLSQHLEMFPKSFKNFLHYLPSWLNEKLRFIKIIRKKLKYKGDVIFIEHHLAHAASTFLISPFEKAAILTIDGVGEWTTTAYGLGCVNDIHLIKEIRFPHSLGLLYSTITAYLGFSVNNSEYKVMGLSAFGNTDKNTNLYYNKLKKVIDIKEDGSFCFDMSYFIYHYADKMPSKKLCELLGGPIVKKGERLAKRHEDIAAALQIITEEVVLKILNHIYKITKCENIVLAGGVGLNSVCNGKILKNTSFKRIWIQPDAGDGGTSMGAAFYIYNTILKKERNFILNHNFWGPEYSDDYVKKFLNFNKVKYLEFKDKKELIEKTAKLILEKNIIGWFQGRMEWGPRALGARSILANPCYAEMKDILNLKVKHREKFRPFAPVVLAEKAKDWFDCDNPLPDPTDFMLMVYPIKEDKKKFIPTVVHVDGSGRLQSVKREQNPLYYDLIREFENLTGIPILVNTSFNIRGEPIVCTPYDAYRCMMGTEIDYLVMNKFLIRRSDNYQDIWDSEKYAKD